MAINLAKARDRMTRFANRTRVSKHFQQGEVVKLQTGRATHSEQNKLQPRFRVTDIVRSLGNDNYEIRLPEGSNIHPIVHAEKLEKFWTADSSKFPLAQQPAPSVQPQETPAQIPHNEQTYPIGKYLLRNWSTVPPRYYVQWIHPPRNWDGPMKMKH